MDGGRKNDSEKLRYDLIPPGPLQEVVHAYTVGAKKYDPWNWRKGLAFSRLYAGLFRHLQAWWMGEERDQEDGHHHLAAVAWAALCLMQLEMDGRADLDDRPK